MKKLLSSPLIPVLLVLAVVLSSCGDDKDDVATTPDASVTTAHGGEKADDSHAGEKATPDRTVEVDMDENSFKPARFAVTAGETVRFVFHNRGKLVHEAILGDEAEHADHEKKMQEQGREMEHSEDEKPIRPGEMTEVTHTFKAGEALLFGCHLPGHYKAGMKAPITVT